MHPIEMLVSWVLWSLALLAASRCIRGVHLANGKAAFKAAFWWGILSGLGSLALWIFLPFIRVLPIVGQAFKFIVVGIPTLYLTELFVPELELDDLATAAKTAVFGVVLQVVYLLLVR